MLRVRMLLLPDLPVQGAYTVQNAGSHWEAHPWGINNQTRTAHRRKSVLDAVRLQGLLWATIIQVRPAQLRANAPDAVLLREAHLVIVTTSRQRPARQKKGVQDVGI